MAANHLVIGLGGTGGKIIRALRKAVYQEFRKDHPDGADIGYVYVDSSNEMMALDDPSWKTLGVSVQLPKASQLLITDANLKARLENIDNYPGIKPWIGARDQWLDILNSIIGVTLGGQKRRLGRFLFACKAQAFNDVVGTQVKALQSSGLADVTFHVCVGLAGGTGSGSLVDAVAQIRDTYTDPKRYRILIYALLPDEHPLPGWNTGNYHANGYAALCELNALSVGAYQPYDVNGQKGRLTLQDPFNGCYIFTNENESGVTVDVDKQLPNVVADFLYQKIVSVKNVSWPTLGRMENAENGDGSPETAPNSKRGERAKRFLAFGIKRLAIPEEEIGEFLTYSFARQATLQLRYNHWSGTGGFLDEPRNADFNEFVRARETDEKWFLTDEHLTLSLGILAEDISNRKWRPITAEWEAVLPNFKSLVRGQERAVWLDELNKLCDKRFNEDYRGLGVKNFYRTKAKAKKEMAREIRSRVEAELFNDWKLGTRSAFEIGRLLAALLDYLDERLRICDDRLARVKANAEEAAQRLFANAEKWAGMGFLSKSVLGTPDSLLDAHAVQLQELFVARTRIEGWMFAKEFLPEIIAQITDLKAEVDAAGSTLGEAAKRSESGIAERCRDQGLDLRGPLVRFYDQALVQRIDRALTADENEQRVQAGRVRNAIVGKLGESPSFTIFNQRLNVSGLMDVFETECEESVRIAHTNLVQNQKERVLGVSIIDKLRERYGSDTQALRSFVTDLVAQAGNFIAFEPLEVNKVAPGIPAGVPTAVSRFTVIMPKSQDQPDFVKALCDAFKGSRSGDVEIIESDVKPNEITLISITNLFPLRYLKPVAMLRQKYEQRLSQGDAGRVRLEIHGEGDGSQFPSIYVASSEEIKRDGLPYLLLAKTLGLVQQSRHPQTGASQVLLVTKDEHGFDNEPTLLGTSMPDALEALSIESQQAIRTAVGARLDGAEFAHEDSRAPLIKALLTDMEALKAERGGNLQDEVYRRFLDGAKRATKILKRES